MFKMNAMDFNTVYILFLAQTFWLGEFFFFGGGGGKLVDLSLMKKANIKFLQ
jgi:hypothetical protein